MAEYIVTAGEGPVKVSHHFRRSVATTPDALRPRLASALERLGYDVVSGDDAVVARRGGRGWSGAGLSYDVRDYPAGLTVLLKRAGERGTLATFDYSLTNPMMTGGDRRTLEREAEAAVALALSSAASAACGACGSLSEGDSRYCRACGVALAAEPAEVEVFRQAAESHAAYRAVATGTVGVIFSLLTFLLVIWIKGPAHLNPAIVFALLWAAPALASLAFGMRRLRRALTPPEARRAIAPPPTRD